MASTINFRRLVLSEANHILDDFKDSFNFQVVVADSAKRALWGDDKARNQGGEFPIWLAGRIIGYVMGPPQSYCVASMLSMMAQMELDKREATDKVLDKESELSLIQEINAKISASLDVAEIAMTLVDEATSFIESTGASIMLLNEDNGRLEIAAAFGKKFEDRPVLKPGVGIVGDVLLTGVPEVVNDVSADSRYVPGAYPVCSLICVPIAASNRVIGAMNISNERPTNYGESEVKHALALAMNAASAIEKAREHEKAVSENTGAGSRLKEEIVHVLGKAGEKDLRLGDSAQEEMSILFSGMRSYAEHYGAMTHGENVDFFNRFLGVITPPISKYGGFVDRYEGDGVMAVFPEMGGAGPEQALLAAMEMQRAVSNFSEARRKASQMTVDMGIGVNTGQVSVGIVESQGDLESVLLGEPVGIASKIERLSKLYGVRLAISGKTYDALSDRSLFKIREVDMVVLPGKDITVSLYDVFSADPEGICQVKQQNLAAYNEAIELFRSRQWEGARRIFSRLQTLMPFDRVVAIHARRCQAFEKSPPGEAWAGVCRPPEL